MVYQTKLSSEVSKMLQLVDLIISKFCEVVTEEATGPGEGFPFSLGPMKCVGLGRTATVGMM